MNRAEDARKALSSALEIALNKEIVLKQTTTKNRKHNDAFLTYLRELIPKIPVIDSSSESQILHLGESHCLTFIIR